jgi:hypothetical protein
MAVLKALLIAGLVTMGLIIIVFLIIPLGTFLIIFGGIALIAYAIIKEEKEDNRPPL